MQNIESETEPKLIFEIKLNERLIKMRNKQSLIKPQL